MSLCRSPGKTGAKLLSRPAGTSTPGPPLFHRPSREMDSAADVQPPRPPQRLRPVAKQRRCCPARGSGGPCAHRGARPHWVARAGQDWACRLHQARLWRPCDSQYARASTRRSSGTLRVLRKPAARWLAASRSTLQLHVRPSTQMNRQSRLTALVLTFQKAAPRRIVFLTRFD
jgi:hypothetical protein